MKLRNKIVLIIVCAVMAILLGSTKAKAEVITGSKNGVNWNFDTETGVVTFSGSGTIEKDWNEISSIEKFDVKSVIIENGITGIGEAAFGGISPKEIADSNAERYAYVTTVIIANSVTSIGNEAFKGCSSLTSIEIPNSVTSIGDDAFHSSGLTSITIPDSVTSIGEGAFRSCYKLTSVTISNSIISIKKWTFFECISLTNVTIPNSVTSIDGMAFSYCSSLTNVTISNSVKSIDDAFSYCSSLTNVTISNSVTSIDGAFYGCSSLTSVTIPDSVTSIGAGTFKCCSSLTNITIPNSVTSLGKYWQDGSYSSPFDDNLTIYCHKNSYTDKFGTEQGWKIKYLEDGDNSGNNTNYTKLPTKTINNQKYITGISLGKNTVNEILSSSNFTSGTTVKAYKYGQEISGDEKIGTGTVVKVYENGEEKTEYVAVVYGDTDGDGDMTAVDALAIVKNKTGEVPFTTDAQKEAAKISAKDEGEEAGAVDALAITLIIIGKANWNEKTGSVEYVGQSDDVIVNKENSISINQELTQKQ